MIEKKATGLKWEQGRITGIKTTLSETLERVSPAGSEVVVGAEKEIMRLYVK